jgi:hypothetical protein
MERSGRGLIQNSIPTFILRDWGMPQKTSVGITRLCADFWTRNLPNTKQEC